MLEIQELNPFIINKKKKKSKVQMLKTDIHIYRKKIPRMLYKSPEEDSEH